MYYSDAKESIEIVKWYIIKLIIYSNGIQSCLIKGKTFVGSSAIFSEHLVILNTYWENTVFV